MCVFNLIYYWAMEESCEQLTHCLSSQVATKLGTTELAKYARSSIFRYKHQIYAKIHIKLGANTFTES